METSKEGSVFDKTHVSLDQRVFRGITPRRSIIKFIEHKVYSAFQHQFGFDCKPFLDLYLTGSLTTLQYSAESDCDISIFIDYQNWPTGIADANVFRTSLIGFVIDRLDGIHLPGTQHPLQLFIVAPGVEPKDLYQPDIRSAWSFTYKAWFVEPDFSRHHNVKEELPGMYLRAAAIGRKLDAMIDTNPQAAIEMYKRIHRRRQLDQQRGRGDFSEGNIIYKWLAHEGIFDRLRGLGVKISSPWINEYGDAIGYDKDEDPSEEYGYEGEYEWSDEDVPEEDDGYISDDRGYYNISLNGKHVSTQNEWIKAIRILASEMERQGYFPNCWYINDHGNYDQLNIQSELKDDQPLPAGSQIQEYYTGYDQEWVFGTVEKAVRNSDFNWVYTIKYRDGYVGDVPEDYVEPYNAEEERKQILRKQEEKYQEETQYAPGDQQYLLSLDPKWDEVEYQSYGEAPPPQHPYEKKPRFSYTDPVPCVTDFGEPEMIIETPWPNQTQRQPVKTSAEEIPYAYSEQLYGWKALNVSDDGTLVSPSQHTPWPVGEPLRAPNFNPSETVRGVSGIHTTDQEHWHELYDYLTSFGVLVKCALYGQTIRGSKGVYRSQGAMPVLAIGTDKELLLKVANKYHIDTEYVGENEQNNIWYQNNDGWKIIGPPKSGELSYQGFDFSLNRHRGIGDIKLEIIDPEGENHGRISLEWDEKEVYGISIPHKDLSAIEVIREFFERERQNGQDFTWSRSSEEGVNIDAEGEGKEYWDRPLQIDDLNDLLNAFDEFTDNAGTYTETEYDDEVRYEISDDTDEYGLKYWNMIQDWYWPRGVEFTPNKWQELLYQAIDELVNPNEETEWSPQEIEQVAQAFYYVPVFLATTDAQHFSWYNYDLSIFFASNLRVAYEYAERLQNPDRPQNTQLFDPNQYQQQPASFRTEVFFFLNYLAQLAGTGKTYTPNKKYDYSTSPAQPSGWGTPYETWEEPRHMAPPKSPLVFPGGLSHWKEAKWELPSDPLPIQVLYDFNNDSIILGNNPTFSSDEDHIHISGEYDGRNVILYHEKDHWINANYFKKLWKHSFPNRPIHEVYLHNKLEPELVPTKNYRRPLSNWTEYGR